MSIETNTGFNHSDKYESQLGLVFPKHGKIMQNRHVPNPQAESVSWPAPWPSLLRLAGSVRPDMKDLGPKARQSAVKKNRLPTQSNTNSQIEIDHDVTSQNSGICQNRLVTQSMWS